MNFQEALALLKDIKRFVDDEDGASGIEYAIIATMVAVVLVAFSGPIAGAIRTTFSSICVALGGSSCPT